MSSISKEKVINRKAYLIKHVLNMFILLFLLLLIPCITFAGIRVYDDAKGGDVNAIQEGGKLEDVQDLQINSIPRQGEDNNYSNNYVEEGFAPENRNSPLFTKAKSPSDIKLLPWEQDTYDLGYAQFFVDGGKLSSAIAKNIAKIKNIEGLRSAFYLKDQESFDEIVHFARNGLLEMGSGVEFATDVKNKRFKALRLNNYMSVYYTSPFGDTREFPLNNPQYILKKIDEVSRQIRGQQ